MLKQNILSPITQIYLGRRPLNTGKPWNLEIKEEQPKSLLKLRQYLKEILAMHLKFKIKLEAWKWLAKLTKMSFMDNLTMTTKQLIVDLPLKDTLFKWEDALDSYAVSLMDHLSSFYHLLFIHYHTHLMVLSIFMLSLKLIWMNGRSKVLIIRSAKVNLWQALLIFLIIIAMVCLWLLIYKDQAFYLVIQLFILKTKNYLVSLQTLDKKGWICSI